MTSPEQPPSNKVRTLQILSSIFAAPFVGLLVSIILGFVVEAVLLTMEVSTPESYLYAVAWIFCGSFAMIFLHKAYQRLRITQMILLWLAVPAVLVSPLLLYLGTSWQEDIVQEKAEYRSADPQPDGPPPDFMGLGEGIAKLVEFTGCTFLIAGTLLVFSCVFGVAGRKELAKERIDRRS